MLTTDFYWTYTAFWFFKFVYLYYKIIKGQSMYKCNPKTYKINFFILYPKFEKERELSLKKLRDNYQFYILQGVALSFKNFYSYFYSP